MGLGRLECSGSDHCALYWPKMSVLEDYDCVVAWDEA